MTLLSNLESSEKILKQNEIILKEGKFPKGKIEAILLNNIHGSLLYGYGRYFGIPLGIRKPKNHIFDKPLELTLLEAMYLLSNQIITINSEKSKKKWKKDEFFEYGKKNFPQFEEKYTIYHDLREKKYIPRPGQKFGADFIVYREGPGIDHASFCISVLSNNSEISSIDVVRSARLATSVKKRFILANPLTKSYFSFKWYKP